MNNKIKTIFLSCFICFSVIAILEFTARYIIRQPYYAFPEGYFINNEFYGYELAKNFKSKYSQPEFTIDISTNSQGLRDTEYYPDKEKFKILALGDSFTFGAGVELNDTYLSGLEQSLNDNRGKFLIIKAGVIGYSTFNEKIYLEKKGLSYRPDMVMVQFWWDDLGIDYITYLAETGFLTSGKIKNNAQLRIFLNKHFRSYALARRIFTLAVNKALFAHRTVTISESPDSLNDKFAITAKQFKEIESFCSNNQIPCLFILIPPKEFVYNEATRYQWQAFCEFLDKNNLQYFDALPSLKAAVLKGEQVFFKVDPHLNKNGHKVIAEAIEKYMF